EDQATTECSAQGDKERPCSSLYFEDADGKLSVKFGVLFQDDRCANLFEALVGTLKAAKRRKIVTYAGELLLQGVHDDVDIVLLQD
ncbi:mCG7517, isoform CRA_b, partial [Mus musculus]